MKGKYLITTDSWFYAPDGKQYKAVWGEVSILSDSILEIKTNARSANWFARVGSDYTVLFVIPHVKKYIKKHQLISHEFFFSKIY